MPYKDPEKRRECNRKKNKVYREKNLEEMRAKAREKYAQAHPPQPKKPTKTLEEKRAYQRAYQRAYYQANKERCKELTKKWVANNKERMREIVRDWQKKNPERVKEQRKQYRKENGEHVRTLAKIQRARRRAENPEKVKAQHKAAKERQKVNNPNYITLRRNTTQRAQKRRVAQIRDGYVAHLLSKSTGFRLHAGDIPKELIEAKRLQLMIKRELEK
jgi:hypothetical protein